MNNFTIGQVVTCSETGKQFTVARDGYSFNYATDSQGRIFSDEGVDIAQRRDLLDRSKPFFAYVSGDARRITGWKGNTLATVTHARKGRVGFCHDGLYIRCTDVHGRDWYGKNAGAGMCITLRPVKD